jgi:4-amino-4-deoxy-L-arabinose transferase-like glycosyltransferase
MVATHLARGDGHHYYPTFRAYRPPAQAFLFSLAVDEDAPLAALDEYGFLGRLHELDPAQPDPEVSAFLAPLVAITVALGIALVALVWGLARALFDGRIALVAAAIAAVNPTLIAYCHYLWSETLFAVLATAGLLTVVHARQRESAALAAVAGVVFGAATLTREIGLPIAGACALWWWWTSPAPRRRGFLLASGMVAVTVLAVLPWTARNYHVFGRIVPVATVGWAAAGEGNSLESPEWYRFGGDTLREYKDRYFTIADEMERLDFARSHTWERIRAEQPSWIFKKSVLGVGRLFAPDSFLLRKLRIQAYDSPSPTAARLWLVATVAMYVPVVLLATLGIAACRGARLRLPLLVLGTVCAMHVFAIAHTRYRLPWMPLLMAYASFAVVDRDQVRETLRGRRWLGPALAWVFFAAVCVPYAWESWSALWESTARLP